MEAHSRYFDEHFAAGRLLLYSTVRSWQRAGLSGLRCSKSRAKLRLGCLAKAPHL
jgi:hypothetical protein